MSIAVNVGLRALPDLDRIGDAIVIAVVFAFIWYAVLIDVKRCAVQDVLLIINAIAVAVVTEIPNEGPTAIGPRTVDIVRSVPAHHRIRQRGVAALAVDPAALVVGGVVRNRAACDRGAAAVAIDPAAVVAGGVV